MGPSCHYTYKGTAASLSRGIITEGRIERKAVLLIACLTDTGFQCNGRVEGGYYADPAAECQVGHARARKHWWVLHAQLLICARDNLVGHASTIINLYAGCHPRTTINL